MEKTIPGLISLIIKGVYIPKPPITKIEDLIPPPPRKEHMIYATKSVLKHLKDNPNK